MRRMVSYLVHAAFAACTSFAACAAFGAAFAAWPATTAAEEVDRATLESMKRQMDQMQKQMQELQRKIDAMEATESAPVPAEAAPVAPTAAPAPIAPAAAPASATSTAPPAPQPEAPTSASWSPSQPIPLVGSGANYLNISFDILADAGTSTERDVTELQLGDHDPNQRGFTLPNAELALDGAVDPYFRAFANVVFKIDEDGETAVELEEAYGLTTSLPWNLQVKAGQYLTEFGRQNQQHPHTWDFVDQPLVLGRLLGGEGMRSVGARLSWLAPTPFYTEVMLAVLNGEGETAASFRNPDDTFGRTPVDRDINQLDDLLYVPRLVTSFDVSDTQTLVAGASGAFGPNDTGNDTETQIYGGDLYWKWRPVRAQRGFPFVAWQTEGLYRRYEAGQDADPAVLLPEEILKDWGFYSQLLYGFHPGWAAGLRGEFVSGDHSEFDDIEPDVRADRTRISPNMTWYPTEFSKLRLQYNFDDGEEFGSEHSVWLQAEFILGAHAAHKF